MMEWLTENWPIIAQLAAILAGGIGIVPAVNWLKAKFNLAGFKAQALAGAMALLWAVLLLIGAGEIRPGPLDAEGLAGVIALVWATSQAVYRQLARNATVELTEWTLEETE